MNTTRNGEFATNSTPPYELIKNKYPKAEIKQIINEES